MFDKRQMAEEYIKAYSDKSRTYFMEKYLSTFDGTEGRYVPFVVFPRQKVFCEALANNSKVIPVKHRQCGISTCTCGWITGELTLARPDAPANVLLIANKLEQACELVTKIRDFLVQVPRWYWGDDYYSDDPASDKNTKDIFIKNSKTYLELCNGCKVYARASSPNAARGISGVRYLVFDESAFLDNAMDAYTSAVSATSSIPDSRTALISTPNGHDPLFYNTYKQALEKKNGFTIVMFKWFQDPRYNRYLKWYKKNEETGEVSWIEEPVIDSEGRIEYNEEKWAQLEMGGWKPTSPWYKRMCESFNNDPMRIAQELDVSFLGSSDNVVPADVIEEIRTRDVCDPLADYGDPVEEDTWFWKRPIEGHRYILACLPEGEQVMTQRGLVNVESVNDNDLLVTKEGEYTRIAKRMIRSVDNEKIVRLRLTNLCDYTSFTWNHPIFASCNTKLRRHRNKNNNRRYWDWNFKFVNAKDVNINDWVQIPNIYASNTLTDEEILSHWKTGLTRKDFQINNPLLNETFWWFCGMWLAEGWVEEDKYGNLSVQTAHNINETDFIEKIKKLANNAFNRSAIIMTSEKTNSVKIIISSKELSHFMLDNFGKYAKFKHVNEWIKFLPNKFKVQFVRGYIEGDGYIEKNKLYCGFTSISSMLLKSMQDILFSLGIISGLKLHVKEGYYKLNIGREKICYCQNKYELTLGKYDTQELLKLFSIESDVKITKRRGISNILFSDDKKTIYFKVVDKIEEQYTGHVYNFETESDSHTFCCRGLTTHNCDPSVGSSDDRTSMQIIDADGVDQHGMPYIEQIMEYNGRVLGDKLGDMAYKYATLYNNAYIVVDATGGTGDACLLRLMNYWGYRNLYYDDNVMKDYMKKVERGGEKYAERMPGFHFQGNRFSLLRNFANMVTEGSFVIHSARLCNELDTWIFKGEDGRMDHQAGSHDDNITCCAVALFIYKFSYQKLEAQKTRDAVILNSYMAGGGYRKPVVHQNPNGTVAPPNNILPFYSSRNAGRISKVSNSINNNFMWLFASRK